MSDLKTNLESILEEKQNKIIPENIKKDIQIFDDYTNIKDNYNKALETSKEIKGIN